MSNYFLQLNPYLNKIGFSATVGGGTRIIKYIETMMCDNITSMHIIVNGTLNYIFEEMSKGSGIAEAIKNAKTLGYVEPGANNILDIVNEESYHDIPMKLSILHNFFKFGKIIKTNDIKAKKITKSELNQLTEEAYYRRYIISLRKYPMEEKNIIGGFEYKTDKWNISAGFKNISKKTSYMKLKCADVNNAVLIIKGNYGADGIYKLEGPGAGSGPTTASMIKDALTLLCVQ
ncbi:MAG: hypothetical protein B6U87_01825 [Candidatus Aenigmarchaeota archaeon ex4484_52]|nr:MAG: hypothetical protein B6U87_01825 [Candidatus Aenigmarchaeota archaeon ex4484_52]